MMAQIYSTLGHMEKTWSVCLISQRSWRHCYKQGTRSGSHGNYINIYCAHRANPIVNHLINILIEFW